MKPSIKISDNLFVHSKGGSFVTGDFNIPPTFFDWSFNGGGDGKICVMTESMFHLADSVIEPVRVLLILESSAMMPEFYEMIKKPENYNKFSYILTHNDELVNCNPEKFKHYVFGGCWIPESDRKIYDKSKDISIIASFKRMTPCQIMRHNIIDTYGDKISGIYGNGYKKVENKLEALKDFRYSIVVENVVSDTFFTEKIIDCFLTGTIPIYCGTRKITDYFNGAGIIPIHDMFYVKNALSNATPDFYESNLDAIKDNFERAKKYVLAEDGIWNKYFKQHYE